MRKKVLITGASSDIGMAIAEKLIRKKYFICFNVKNLQYAKKINSFFQKYEKFYEIFIGDISDEKFRDKLIKQICKKY